MKDTIALELARQLRRAAKFQDNDVILDFSDAEQLLDRLEKLESQIGKFQEESLYYRAQNAKMQAVVDAAQDFLDSDGDYFSWTEDERHCLSRLKETVLAALGDKE